MFSNLVYEYWPFQYSKVRNFATHIFCISSDSYTLMKKKGNIVAYLHYLHHNKNAEKLQGGQKAQLSNLPTLGFESCNNIDPATIILLSVD